MSCSAVSICCSVRSRASPRSLMNFILWASMTSCSLRSAMSARRVRTVSVCSSVSRTSSASAASIWFQRACCCSSLVFICVSDFSMFCVNASSRVRVSAWNSSCRAPSVSNSAEMRSFRFCCIRRYSAQPTLARLCTWLMRRRWVSPRAPRSSVSTSIWDMSRLETASCESILVEYSSSARSTSPSMMASCCACVTSSTVKSARLISSCDFRRCCVTSGVSMLSPRMFTRGLMMSTQSWEFSRPWRTKASAFFRSSIPSSSASHHDSARGRIFISRSRCRTLSSPTRLGRAPAAVSSSAATVCPQSRISAASGTSVWALWEYRVW
mmetsp:Transcript_73416/g.123696  ORF Transcript_73416/g.123696 Transcript_73416/m.123696 type:complete len:325 (-) Transcript_73416:138-1112(-)